jgi:hypothetical protein
MTDGVRAGETLITDVQQMMTPVVFMDSLDATAFTV